MQNFTKTLQSLSVPLSEEYLQIGNLLAQGCYNGHKGYEYSIMSLKSSDSNTSLFFNRFNISQSEYWNTLHSLSDSDSELYLKALYEFSSFMLSGWD